MKDDSPRDYSDIIDLPHHQSRTHPHMSLLNRAAQFAPFAALTGYGEAIDEAARLTDRRVELSEAEQLELNEKLKRLGARLPGIAGDDDATYANMIQFSAAVREGASGGGLYDIQGKLIGICTTMSVEEAHPADIGYAIPITYVVPITQRLKEGKLAMHATIGARYTAVPEEDIDRFGLDSSEGAYIDNVTPNGVAHQAGMMKGDIIVSIDGKKITEPMDAIYTIWAKQPGDQIEVLVLREGKEQQFTVKLGSDNNA